MAQGYIEPSEESLSLEDVGGIYFLELQRRNLFQEDVNIFGYVRYKMHDLVHVLALHVAGAKDVSSSLLTMMEMRTLLNSKFAVSILREMNPRFQSLRALSLVGFAERTLPDCIGRLRHLRCLNLEGSSIECLPTFITKLECLQTLNLDRCNDFRRWPRGFSKLANLRHLGIKGCSFDDMPSGFGRMRSLVELNRFVVGRSNGVDALGALDLRGDLTIDFHRWRRNTVVEARRVHLKDKQRLIRLTFNLKFKEVEVTPASGDMELLLECLILPPNLEYLEIKGYSGERFPTWMLPNLVTVNISFCKSCVQLPQFSQLPRLKYLTLENFEALEYIEEDGWGGDGESCSATHFVALEILRIWNMPKLKGWFSGPRVKDWDVQPQQAAMTSKVHQDLTSHRVLSFPRLSSLFIWDCPQFVVSMPLTLLPRLEKLDVENIHEKVLESLLASHREAPSYSFPSSSSPTHSTLKYLSILDVNIVSFSINFCNLETLHISNCEKLTSLIVVSPNSSIRKLRLSKLKNLRALPEEIGHLSQLGYLRIWYCFELASLPQSIRGLSSLQSLIIGGCPHLETRCRKPDGEDWPLIQHIPNIEVS